MHGTVYGLRSALTILRLRLNLLIVVCAGSAYEIKAHGLYTVHTHATLTPNDDDGDIDDGYRSVWRCGWRQKKIISFSFGDINDQSSNFNWRRLYLRYEHRTICKVIVKSLDQSDGKPLGSRKMCDKVDTAGAVHSVNTCACVCPCWNAEVQNIARSSVIYEMKECRAVDLTIGSSSIAYIVFCVKYVVCVFDSASVAQTITMNLGWSITLRVTRDVCNEGQ